MKTNLTKTVKRLFYVSFVVLFVLFITGCPQDESADNPIDSGYFSIDFSMASGSHARSSAYVLSQVESLIVTIESDTGAVIYNREYFSINDIGSSALIRLEVGDYELTELILLDANSQIILATPKSGSALDYLLSEPLPLDFSIVSSQTLALQVQVVDVYHSTMAQFGYDMSDLGFEVIETFDLPVVTFKLDTALGKFILSAANIVVSDVHGELFSTTLPAGISYIKLRTDIPLYNLLVHVDGYDTLLMTGITDSLMSNYTFEQPLEFSFGNIELIPSCISFCLEPTLESNPPDQIEISIIDPVTGNEVIEIISYDLVSSCQTSSFPGQFSGCGNDLNLLHSLPNDQIALLKMSRGGELVSIGLVPTSDPAINLYSDNSVNCPFGDCYQGRTNIDPCTGSGAYVMKPITANTATLSSELDLPNCRVILTWYDPIAEADGTPFDTSNFWAETTIGDPNDVSTVWETETSTTMEIRPGLYTTELSISETAGAEDIDCDGNFYFFRTNYANNPGIPSTFSCIDLSPGCSGC